MRLTHLLKGLEYESKGSLNLLNAEISGLVFDSRKAESGTVFLAIKGANADGHNYIDKAVKQGVEVVVCENVSELIPDVL